MTRPGALPRRVFLGLAAATPDGLGARAGAGLEVVGVHPGATADALGLRRGDHVLAIDGRPTGDRASLLDAVAGVRVGDEVALQVRRGPRTWVARARAVGLPLESYDAAEVRLDAVRVGGSRLRVIYTVPTARDDARPRPAIVYLQGLACQSCETPLEPRSPVRRMIAAWSAAGYVTARIEKRGVGDSDGPPCAALDFHEELAGFAAGLEHARARVEVDPGRVFLFGHSLGGMIAPLLARRHAVRGIAVYGTSARSWVECELGAYRRQRGAPPAELVALLDAVVRGGVTPDDVFAGAGAGADALRRALGREFHGESMHGRPAAYFQQLERAGLADAWREVPSGVLAMHGARDRVCAAEDAAEIARIVNASRPGAARHVELDGLDHTGQGAPDGPERLAAVARAWFDGLASTG